MRRVTTILLISCMTLTACGGVRDTNWNPGNWFGGSTVEKRAKSAAAPQNTNPLIPEEQVSIFRRDPSKDDYEGTPIYTVTDLVIERSSGGAIISATGLSQRQGAYDVRLRPQNDGEPIDVVLTYSFEAIQSTVLPQGTQRSRTVNAARFVTTQTL